MDMDVPPRQLWRGNVGMAYVVFGVLWHGEMVPYGKGWGQSTIMHIMAYAYHGRSLLIMDCRLHSFMHFQRSLCVAWFIRLVFSAIREHAYFSCMWR